MIGIVLGCCGMRVRAPDLAWSCWARSPSRANRTLCLVSPLGIGAVLAMLAQGAKDPVRRSIREMLGVGSRHAESADAAETTPAVMTTRAAPAEGRFDLKVDRPFAFAVVHRDAGVVLFVGWVDNPLGG